MKIEKYDWSKIYEMDTQKDLWNFGQQVIVLVDVCMVMFHIQMKRMVQKITRWNERDEYQVVVLFNYLIFLCFNPLHMPRVFCFLIFNFLQKKKLIDCVQHWMLKIISTKLAETQYTIKLDVGGLAYLFHLTMISSSSCSLTPFLHPNKNQLMFIWR